MGALMWVALVMSVLSLTASAYLLFVALPQVGDGMTKLGNGLQELSGRFQDFANFMAQKLG